LLGSEGAVSTIAGEVFLAGFQGQGLKATTVYNLRVAAAGALGATGQGVGFEVEVAVVEGEEGGEGRTGGRGDGEDAGDQVFGDFGGGKLKPGLHGGG
jgi:hypothetical protein